MAARNSKQHEEPEEIQYKRMENKSTEDMRDQKPMRQTSMVRKTITYLSIGCILGAVLILCWASTQMMPTFISLISTTRASLRPTKILNASNLQTKTPYITENYFAEDFDAPLSDNWSHFTITTDNKADPRMVAIQSKGGKLVWDFNSPWVYYYLFYNSSEFDDVKLDMSVENKGKNSNSVSLVCRHVPDKGWFEFNIANNGLYSILFMEVLGEGRFRENRLADGGSNAIRQGQSINEYSVICQDEKFTLRINGSDVITVIDTKYGLSSGQVGISVSSFNVLPIIVEMEWFRVSAP